MKKDPYKESGVDSQKGDEVVDWLQSHSSPKKNHGGKVLSGVGGFAALFKPKFKNYSKPVIVSSTDGVGTKLLLGLEHNKLPGLGADLVGMCVNDLYCVGAQPLFFLDYFATGKLNPEQFKKVLGGIKKSCDQANMPLIGGETAELPGLYQKNHFDLAGFVVGVVEHKKILGPKRVRENDVVYAVSSSGFHSNGYSLIRQWLEQKKPSLELIEQLLTPTTIYSTLAEDISKHPTSVHALAHITGGGMSGNIPRVVPEDLCVEIDRSSIATSPWMKEFILNHVKSFDEIESVFNLGVGMTMICDPKIHLKKFSQKHFKIYPIGSIKKRQKKSLELTYYGKWQT